MAHLKLMRHATAEEQNAAFDSVYHELMVRWIPQLPGFVQGQARKGLESREGRQAVLDIIDGALDAAQAVREAAEKAAEVTTDRPADGQEHAT